jgi:predicted CopG family antitoxin
VSTSEVILLLLLKKHERSEFIAAFTALASQTELAKNCPKAVSDSEQQ